MAFLDDLKGARSEETLNKIQEMYTAFEEETIKKYQIGIKAKLQEEILQRVRKGEKGRLSGTLEIHRLNSKIPAELSQLIKTYNPELSTKFKDVFLGKLYWDREVSLIGHLFEREVFKQGIFLLKKECVKIYFTDFAKSILKILEEQALADGIKIDFSNCTIIAYDDYADEDGSQTIGSFSGIDGYCLLKEKKYSTSYAYAAHHNISYLNRLRINYEIEV